MKDYVPTQHERESAEAREALWNALGRPDKLYEIAAALTAAEERGRRRADEILKRALYEEGYCEITTTGELAAAPKGHAPSCYAGVNTGCNCWVGMARYLAPRDSGKLPTHNERAAVHTDKCLTGEYDTECK